MNFAEFLIHCHRAWASKEQAAKTIAEQEKISIPLLSGLLDLDELTATLAVAYLTWCGEVSVVGLSGGDKISPEFSSRRYLLDKENRLKAERKRVMERVRSELTEEYITIPALARKLGEKEDAVTQALADLAESGEEIETGRSIQATDGSNAFFPTYAKPKRE